MHMTCQKYTYNPCIAKTQNNMVVVLGHFSCSCSWLLPRRLIPPPQHVCVLGTNRTPTPSLLMLMFLLSVVPSPDRGFCSWSSHSAVRLHSVEVLLCGLCVSPATPSTQTDYKALRHPGGVHTYLLATDFNTGVSLEASFSEENTFKTAATGLSVDRSGGWRM